MKQAEGYWDWDESTRTWGMPPLPRKFLDWLLMYPQRVPDTLTQWCKDNDVAMNTTQVWRKDKRFVEVWEREAKSKHMSTDRNDQLMDVLYKSALQDPKIAIEYLKIIERYKPRSVIENKEIHDLGSISDDELEKLMEEAQR